MIGEERPPPAPLQRGDEAATAETTREVIKEFAETPPAKTMAELKAASEVFEANAQKLAAKKAGPTPKQQS